MALPLNNNVVAAAGVVESDENFVEEYNRERLQKVKNRLDVFDLNNEQLRRIMVILKTGLTQGLRSEQGYTMSPTFITTNTSTINSNSIILDLGGTRFKIYLVDTSGHIIKKTAITIPEEIKNGSIQQLMSFMAVLLKSFLVEHGLPFNFKMPLGFTFSYPCKHNQQSTTSACLLKWTKGFNAFGFAGRNIVQLLRDACHIEGIKLGMVTIINDTVGTMLACALVNSECSFREKLDNIPKLNDLARMSSNKVICINTEIGSFGDNGLFNDYRNRFDRSLDEASVNRGEQLLEKMISGMYLGNLMKIVVHDLFNAGLIFNNNPNAIAMLEEHNFFITPVITKIEGVMRKSERPLGTIHALINEVGVALSLTDCAVLAHVCTSICYRAEILCAISVASICEHLESKNITIGVDSSVFYSKTALERLESKIESFIGIDKKITLVRTAEASGRGAAVAAAMDINALQSISWNCGIL